MTGTVTRNRTRLAGLALLALGTLSGCGGLHPGVAAEAGDLSITDTQVDSLARDVCTALKSDPRLLGDGFPRSKILQSVVQSFVMRSIADEMGEQYGVSATPSYDKAVEQTKLQFTALDPKVRDNVLDTWLGTNYFVDVLGAIGMQELRLAGAAKPTSDEAVAKGIELAQVWEADNGVTIDPRFPDITLADTQFTQTIDETSYAVSDFAKQASAATPDAAWIAKLPASQRCG